MDFKYLQRHLMAIFSPNSKKSDQNDISFAHPSVTKLKDTLPNITISKSGLIESDRPRSLITIKDKKSVNGSVAGKDVSINGTYKLKSFDVIQNQNISFKQFGLQSQNLPDISQQSGICQSIPFLHMIQNQLDFHMDYDSLWQCVDINWTGNLMMDFYDIVVFSTLFGIKDKLAYPRLFNLLFSPNKCFSVNEIPPKCTDTDPQLVGNFEKKKDCINPCSRRIRIITAILPNINNEKDLCDRLNNLGPCPLVVSGLSALKVQLLSDGEFEFTWEDVKDMDFETVRNLFPESERAGLTTIRRGHMVTITSCTNGMFTVKNSNIGETEFILSWQDIQESFVINPDLLSTLFGLDLLSYYPVVEECQSIAKSPECEEEVCITAGFDGRKYNPDSDECECYCNKVLAPASLPDASWMTCLNAGTFVQKVSGYDYGTDDSKKCVCPDHPEPEFYYYTGEDCCELDWPGSWCERVFCNKTNTYYLNGNTIKGEASEYKQKGELAVGWERDRFISNAPRKIPCVKEDWPLICSGLYEPAPSGLQSTFNIISASSLKFG